MRTALQRQLARRLGRTSIQRCHYRGDSGDAVQNLSKKEQDLLSIAVPRAEEIMERHVRLPNLDQIPEGSLGVNNLTAEELELEVRKKRLIYRSKQRGWLEVDLLLGTWANIHVPSLSASDLNEFEEFVNMETIDIYNIITLRLDVPEELKRADGDGVVQRIQSWARDSPLGKADPETYKTVKKDNNLT